MPQTATIKSLPEAFEVVKAMQTDGLDWGEWWKSVLTAAERARKTEEPAEDMHKAGQTPKPRGSEQTGGLAVDSELLPVRSFASPAATQAASRDDDLDLVHQPPQTQRHRNPCNFVCSADRLRDPPQPFAKMWR